MLRGDEAGNEEEGLVVDEGGVVLSFFLKKFSGGCGDGYQEVGRKVLSFLGTKERRNVLRRLYRKKILNKMDGIAYFVRGESALFV